MLIGNIKDINMEIMVKENLEETLKECLSEISCGESLFFMSRQINDTVYFALNKRVYRNNQAYAEAEKHYSVKGNLENLKELFFNEVDRHLAENGVGSALSSNKKAIDMFSDKFELKSGKKFGVNVISSEDVFDVVLRND